MAETNLEIAFQLAELAEELVAQRYRREHPEADEDEVRDAVIAWIHDRRKAPHGDAPGHLVPFPASR